LPFRVSVDSLQRRDGLTLTLDAALRPLNAHLGVLNKVFQVRADHPAAYPPTSLLWSLFCAQPRPRHNLDTDPGLAVHINGRP
jgi:hypothetical protein